jgi:hypothetical protein
MAHGQSAGDRLGEAAEVLPHALADRLQGLAAGSPRMRVEPHIMSTVSGMMVPSWLRGRRGEPTRVGASRLLRRINRSARRIDVRVTA